MDTAGDRGLGETFAGVLDPLTESLFQKGVSNVERV